MHGVNGYSPGEDTHKVVFPSLDCLLCNVSLVVIRRDEVVHHMRCLDFRFIGGIDFVVYHLVFGDGNLEFHSCKGAASG